ncbi:MAG: superoxide dismutase [Cu-Zn] SodC [Gammaproteobacteria bacterium]
MKHPLLLGLLCSAFMANATQLTININAVDDQGIGKSLGQVIVEDSKFGGVLLTPTLNGLTPGAHGFHVHAMSSCEPSMHDGHPMGAGAAGGHFDPAQTGKHLGPYGDGHLGDLPVLVVNKDGKASTPVLAPRIKADDFKGHALMIHAGGDNYSDTPEALGGGGLRVACGQVS